MQELPTSIQKLIDQLEQADRMTPASLAKMIEKSDISEEDVRPWDTTDHPIEDSYGRTMVHEGDNYEVMVMSWQPWDFSAIHDHGETQWGAVKYFGAAEHTCFKIKNGEMVIALEEETQSGQINLVSNSMIHQMGNPYDKPFLSLHVYGKHVNELPITSNSRVFEPYHDEVQITNGGVFFHLPEAEIITRQDDVFEINDKQVAVKHDYPMLLRTCLMLDAYTGEDNDTVDKLEGIKLDLVKRLFEPDVQKRFLADVNKADLSEYKTRYDIWNKIQPCETLLAA